MARAYLALGMREEAVFSLFVRRLPPSRNFLLCCGVEDLIDTLAALRFSPASLYWLRRHDEFPDEFLSWLAGFRFSGEVRALPEGTLVFPEEPLLEIRAPIAEAQLLETLTMNLVGTQTLFASKAVRIVLAAAGRPVIDFGSRRAQGIDAALAGARAFRLAGVTATSNVLAAARYGIPVAGTMGHSFIQAFEREAEAFRSFAALYPETILLVDTYDTLAGVEWVIALARQLGGEFRVRGVRLDSGDLLALARCARSRLDAAGLREVQIFASGGLDEHKIRALLAAGAPIDAFGVGTDMSVSADAPAFDIAYKLTSFAGTGRTKLSPGKRILPGAKQVFRRRESGRAVGDVIATAAETLAGEALLRVVMRDGRRVLPRPDLEQSRREAAAAVAQLPPALHSLDPAGMPYPVVVSPALMALEAAVRQSVCRSG